MGAVWNVVVTLTLANHATLKFSMTCIYSTVIRQLIIYHIGLYPGSMEGVNVNGCDDDGRKMCAHISTGA